MRKKIFTLVELLTVMVIISILTGLLLPVVSRVRESGRRSSCQSNLRGMGQAIHMYVNDFEGRLPIAAQIPSVNVDLQSINEVLSPYVDNQRSFHCPSDGLGGEVVGGFAREKTSYEYSMNISGNELKQLLARRMGNNRFIMFDSHSFHGKTGSKGSRNYLFIDGRVGEGD